MTAESPAPHLVSEGQIHVCGLVGLLECEGVAERGFGHHRVRGIEASAAPFQSTPVAQGRKRGKAKDVCTSKTRSIN